ncbi:MAG: lipoprotein-releasing ABC transporter permease subunit [bacterium]
MFYEGFIGYRYLKAKHKKAFISIIAFLSMAGISIGVMSLIIVLSVMNGFENDLREKMIGSRAHVVISSWDNKGISDYKNLRQKIKEIKNVKGCAPFISAQVMLKTKTNVKGALIQGIDPVFEKEVSNIFSEIKIGTSKLNTEKEFPSLLIGTELANELEVKIGDKITVISPVFIQTSIGKVPRMKEFEITGIFKTGYYEYDSNLVYVSINSCQNLYNMPDVVTGLSVKINDIFSAPSMANFICKKLDYKYLTRDWSVMNINLFKALKIEKIVMFIILALIVLVAVFNIVSTLIMVVMEKTKDIGILKSLGSTNKSIMSIFMIEGIIIGFIGTFIGSVLGIVGCFLIKVLKINIPGGGEVYYITYLPVKMDFSQITLIIISSIILTFLSTIYPSMNAAKINPAQTLRYE